MARANLLLIWLLAGSVALRGAAAAPDWSVEAAAIEIGKLNCEYWLLRDLEQQIERAAFYAGRESASDLKADLRAIETKRPKKTALPPWRFRYSCARA